MLIKSSLVKTACAATLAWSAVGLANDTAVHSVVSPQCADGSCVPRRLTNGYYPTTWRRWPVEPPSRGKAGVREGISAPKVELPPPRLETYLPEGLLIAPPPDPGGADGGFDPGPRESIPGAPPPGPAAPRGESPQGVPPELRSEPTRTRTQEPMPRRQRAVASRETNRPAAVIEALRSEAAAYPSAATGRGSPANVPAALPNDEGKAQPLPLPAEVELPSARPTIRSTPTLHSQRLDYDHAERADQAGGTGRTNWSPHRAAYENATQPKEASSQPEAGDMFSPPEPATPRHATSSLNAPAAIYARTLVNDPKRSATRADFTISAPHSPATLAVRTVSDEGWNPNSQFRNPLRGKSAVTKVAFEASEVSSEESIADPVSSTAKQFESPELEVPDNPLR
jgi:hypothetical protein